MLVALLLLMAVAGEVLLGVLFPGYVGKAHLAVPLFFLALYAVPVIFMVQPMDAKRFIKLGREVGFNGSVDIVQLFWDTKISPACAKV